MGEISRKWVKFPNFCPGERISLRNMTPVVSKVSLLEISPILVALMTENYGSVVLTVV